MQVKQVADNLGISEHTIRYYDKVGLFPFVQRNKNGYRDFSEEDLYWIEFIKCMRQTHMPISTLKEIAELYHQGSDTKRNEKYIFGTSKNLIEQKDYRSRTSNIRKKFKLLENE